MIHCYGRNGDINNALNIFNEMINNTNIQPNNYTFCNLLYSNLLPVTLTLDNFLLSLTRTLLMFVTVILSFFILLLTIIHYLLTRFHELLVSFPYLDYLHLWMLHKEPLLHLYLIKYLSSVLYHQL